jgi:hypothetical protein
MVPHRITTFSTVTEKGYNSVLMAMKDNPCQVAFSGAASMAATDATVISLLGQLKQSANKMKDGQMCGGSTYSGANGVHQIGLAVRFHRFEKWFGRISDYDHVDTADLLITFNYENWTDIDANGIVVSRVENFPSESKSCKFSSEDLVNALIKSLQIQIDYCK